jgi:SAM-dependent methyltransferase
MWRALAKAAGLFAFGRLPGGAKLYRRITREIMGTQATHVDKLKRVWPGYVRVWQDLCGVKLEGSTIWVHEAGWTPFSAFSTYLLTGRGGVLTNSSGHLLDRFLARAVNGALSCALPESLVPPARRLDIGRLCWAASTGEALDAIGCRRHEGVDSSRIPIDDESVDLVHSGGVLEHYAEPRLRAFLRECRRILRPGGVASHVFDHRDHLIHADGRWPFLTHLAWPRPAYQLLFGHELLFHNRLLPEQVKVIFQESGFQLLALRRMILPAGAYVSDAEVLGAHQGISRRFLSSAYRQASDLDLRTAAAHYLFKKM